MSKPTFRMCDLVKMLRDLTALAASPVGRKMLAEQLGGAIRRSKMGNAMLKKVHLMYDYFRDPAEPLKPKLLIGAALLYLVIPTDLIPDWVAVIGFTDDLAALLFIWNRLKDVLTHYEARRRLREEAAGETVAALTGVN